MTSQNLTKESEPAVSMDTISIVTVGRGGGKRKQVGGITEGGINIYIYKKIYFLVLKDFVLNERCAISLLMLLIKILKTPYKWKKKLTAKINIKSKIKARHVEPNILWERIAKLGVLQTELVSVPLAFFLTTSDEIQFWKANKILINCL